MKLEYIDLSLKKHWEDLTKNNPASGYMQSFFWSEFSNTIGWETYKIGVFEQNVLLGGAIVAKYNHYKNKSVLYIPEGPVLPYENPKSEEMFHLLITEIDTITDFHGEKPTSHLSIEPKLFKVPSYFSRFKKSLSDRQPIRSLLQDLKISEQQILDQMKPKGRYNIKIAQKHDVKIICVDPQKGVSDFYGLYSSFTKKHSFEGKSLEYFQNLAIILSSTKSGNIFFAYFKNELVSAALVVYYGNIVTYLYEASSNKYPFTMAAYKLHWEIIKHAKKLKFSFYDWYGLTPGEFDEHHPWYGFSIFKKKFGGKETNYIGSYDFVYNKKLYKDYLKND